VLKAAILDYTRYNHWANKALTDWLKSLDVRLLYKETPSSFSSIDLTLQHMKNAQNFWHVIIEVAEIHSLEEQIKTGSVDLVIEELLKGSQKMIEMVSFFTDEDLLTNVPSPTMIKTRYQFILHTINHNSYHRGQIITMARSFGITENIPDTDYEFYLWINKNEPKS